MQLSFRYIQPAFEFLDASDLIHSSWKDAFDLQLTIDFNGEQFWHEQKPVWTVNLVFLLF